MEEGSDDERRRWEVETRRLQKEMVVVRHSLKQQLPVPCSLSWSSWSSWRWWCDARVCAAQTGFRDAVVEAKERTLQRGYNVGFRASASHGFAVGAVIGFIRCVVDAPPRVLLSRTDASRCVPCVVPGAS
jgi:hypothetical protein